MASSRSILHCRYGYDPLDRLISQFLAGAAAHQRFYCKSRLSTEIQGAIGYSIFQKEDLLLAQQKRQHHAVESTLLVTDLQRSVLQTLNADLQHPIAYSPYGHRRAESGLSSLLGFNGERADAVTGCYLLGNGYRAFNPILRRFISPDILSPFGEGGLNSYAYCINDPVNASDSSGQSPTFLSISKSLHNGANNTFRQSLTRHGYRKSTATSRRLSAPSPTSPSLQPPDFMGYHGTSKESVKKLITEGVNPKHGTEPDRNGFFFTPDIEVTFDYARVKQNIENNTRLKFNNQFGADNIVEVHMQNLTGMIPGRDYDFNHYSLRPNHMTMEYYAKPHKSRAVIIRKLGTTSPDKKVRPRAHEAPF